MLRQSWSGEVRARTEKRAVGQLPETTEIVSPPFQPMAKDKRNSALNLSQLSSLGLLPLPRGEQIMKIREPKVVGTIKPCAQVGMTKP